MRIKKVIVTTILSFLFFSNLRTFFDSFFLFFISSLRFAFSFVTFHWLACPNWLSLLLHGYRVQVYIPTAMFFFIFLFFVFFFRRCQTEHKTRWGRIEYVLSSSQISLLGSTSRNYLLIYCHGSYYQSQARKKER